MSYYSARGRYRSTCSGRCSTADGPLDSKVQSALFHLLSFALGGGRHDVQFPGDRRMEIDMVFELSSGSQLAVEYDGAYWHLGKESTDQRKTWRLVDSGFVQYVIRLREEPLDLITPADLPVAKGAKPGELAQLILLHLWHEVRPDLPSQDRIETFLRGAAAPVAPERIVCPECWLVAQNAGLLPLKDPSEWEKGWKERRRQRWRAEQKRRKHL